MGDDQYIPGLYDLARAAGVEVDYWDVRGGHHVASVEALLAVVGELGRVGQVRHRTFVPTPPTGVEVEGGGWELRSLADVPGAWASFDHRQASRLLDDVLVCWVGDGLRAVLRVPSEIDRVGRLSWRLVLEDGTVVDGTTQGPAGPTGTVEHHRFGTWQVADQELTVPLPEDLPTGVHTLEMELPLSLRQTLGRAFGTAVPEVLRRPLLFAPVSAAALDAGRSWGAFVPLYSLRSSSVSSSSPSGPTVGDLEVVGRWLAERGGGVVATLPLLASFSGTPFDPSPYAPVSRRFWNELYLDPDWLARRLTGRQPEALPSARFEAERLEASATFDYREQAALSRTLLSPLAARFAAEVAAGVHGADHDDYRRFVGDPASPVNDYARFRALAERFGHGWPSWPEPVRAGIAGAGTIDPDTVDLHLVAQWAMSRQMAELATDFRSRGQRLYLDLPVGAHPDGFDTWQQGDLFASGMSVGAPPDEFFTEGQNWGFPPIRPAASRAQVHQHIRECLRHHMEVAGILRLDHVMGLHRLYWVPDGASAKEGVYVRYPREELFAALAIESRRHDCVVVGEDLGTVPDQIRDAMARHGLLGMYVAEFQLPSWAGAELAAPPARCVASVDTHDTPTFVGFLRGLDIARRVETGLLDTEEAAEEFNERHQQRENLTGFLVARGLVDAADTDRAEERGEDAGTREGVRTHAPHPGEEAALLRGLLGFLGRSDAELVLVSLEDLWGEANPQNVPGTGLDRPNWVQRFNDTLSELTRDPRVLPALEAIDRARRSA